MYKLENQKKTVFIIAFRYLCMQRLQSKPKVRAITRVFFLFLLLITLEKIRECTNSILLLYLF
jgi:hypothetical protein